MSRHLTSYKRQTPFIAESEVCLIVRMSPLEIQRAIREQAFPAPSPNIRPGELLFSRDEVEAWQGKRWLRRSMIC
jgi:predicted DNA-binding transcriptional regulator AlpA